MHYSVYYIPFLSVFNRRKTEKDKKKQQKNKMTGNHIITSEIFHYSRYLAITKKLLRQKIISH